MPVGAWITPGQMKDSIRRYNEADILIENVPAETIAAARSCDVVVCSTSRRCIQSARYLSQGNAFLAEDIFRKADLPHPSWPFPRLPLAVYGVIFRLAWCLGFSANAESRAQASARARVAAERLIGLAKDNGSVFAMGHAFMTILIARHLSAAGWVGRKRPFNKYWRFSTYHGQA